MREPQRPRRHPLFAGLVLAATCTLVSPAAGAGTFVLDVQDGEGAPLADVVIALDPVGTPPARTPRRGIIDQVARQFVPQVSVLQTGTVVDFPNSDRIRHQVYSFSAAKRFNLKLYAGSDAPPITFDAPGLVVLGCNIHDTMLGFVVVVDTPFFAKSTANGRASVEVPAGRYRLRVWHPQLARAVAPREIALGAEGGTQRLALETTAAPVELAAWPE